MKPLEEMDLLDDFLNNCAASSSYNKEIYRIILETLLNKRLGNISISVQKPIIPTSPGKRGIRLDVSVKESSATGIVTSIYDYEPHHGFEAHLQKAIRYRQATIDSQNMPAGSNDFSKLPDLYIIYILDYDPFGADQLMYTVNRTIREAADIKYEDGLHLFYFNTKGHLGGSQSIKNMLSYIRNSRKENVSDEATSKLDEFVSSIKASDEVRDEYMTWDEFVQREVDEATKDLRMQVADQASQLAEKEARIKELEAQLAGSKKMD